MDGGMIHAVISDNHAMVRQRLTCLLEKSARMKISLDAPHLSSLSTSYILNAYVPRMSHQVLFLLMRRLLLKINVPSIAIATLLVTLVFSAGAADMVTQPAPVSKPPQVNAVAQAAVANGVLVCAGRINHVSSFLGYTPQAGALLMTPPTQPDKRLISLAMEVQSEFGAAYVSASFAPNQANGCGAAYDAVVYWPQKCDDVAAKQFAGMSKDGQLKKAITVLDGGMATQVFLMPAGSGCVSIKKEVVL